MKTKQLFIVAFVALVPVFTLSSCQSREERIISRYESLCEEIEEDDDFDTDDMKEYTDQYNEIVNDSKGCSFTSEQQAQLAEITTRFVTVMTKKVSGSMINSAGDIMKVGVKTMNGMIKGLVDGASDIEESMDDIDDSIDDIDDSIEDLEDEINELFE